MFLFAILTDCFVGEFWKSSPAVTWCLDDDCWLLSKTLPTFGEVLEPCGTSLVDLWFFRRLSILFLFRGQIWSGAMVAYCPICPF